MFRSKSLWSTLLIVLIVRVLLVLSRMDEMELELYSGSLATAMLKGLPLNPESLPIIVHLRGSYFMGLLAMPLMALFGGSLWVLKLMAVAWSLATVGLWVCILERVLGSKSALVGGLAYAFLPPSFQMVDIVLLGSHGETILFIAASLYFVLSRPKSICAELKWVCAFGAILGAGFLFSMQFLGVIPAILITWWCHERRVGDADKALRQSLRVGAPALFGSILLLALVGSRMTGMIPMWWQFFGLGCALLALGTWFRSLRLAAMMGTFLIVCSPAPWITRSTKVVNRTLEERFLPDGIGGFFDKFVHAVGVEFHESWLFGAFGGNFAFLLFGGATAVGLVCTLKRALKLDPLAVFLVVYPLFFFGLYAASDLQLNVLTPLDGMGSRYVMPILACVTGWIAIGFHAFTTHGWKRTAEVLATAPVLAGALGLWPLLEPYNAFGQPSPNGAQFCRFAPHLVYAGGEEFSGRMEWVDKLDTQWLAFRPIRYRSTFFLAPGWISTEWDLMSELRKAQKESDQFRLHRMYDLGVLFVEKRGLANKKLLKRFLHAPKSDELPWIVRGMGFAGMRRAFSLMHKIGKPSVKSGTERAFVGHEFLSQFPQELRGYALQGIGFSDGEVLTAFNALPLQNVKYAEQYFEGTDRENYFIGLGLGFRTHYHEDSWFVPELGHLRVERCMGEPARNAFRAGLGAPTNEFPEPR